MLKLSRVLYGQIIEHCTRHYPKEACGLLAGSSETPLSEERTVVGVYPMTNVEESPIGYSMDPREQLKVERTMRTTHQRLIGIYHSHTASDAYPSSVDVGLAISPDLSYVLVSLKHLQAPDLKSYRIDGTRILPERRELI